MIKIENNNIDSIISLFYETIKPYIIVRLDFIIDLFEQINKDRIDIQELEKKYNFHFNTVHSLIRPLLKTEFKKEKISVLKLKNNIFDKAKLSISGNLNFFQNVKKDLKLIITGKPENISKLAKKKDFERQTDKIIKELLEKAFNYERLTGAGFELKNKRIFNSYTLTSMLNLSVCPYCNRNWIVTVSKDGKKITNPQLDHFFSKSDFPILRLSFYNLIPSCETCNARLKKDIEFKFNENLHPYLEGYSNNAKFKVIPKSYEAAIGIKNNYNVEIEHLNKNKIIKKKIDKNHTQFKINEIYEKHGNIISEVYRKKYIWNEKYLEVLKDSFSEFNISKKEMYRLLIGNNIDEKDFNKRPFALLIRDLTKDLNMI